MKTFLKFFLTLATICLIPSISSAHHPVSNVLVPGHSFVYTPAAVFGAGVVYPQPIVPVVTGLSVGVPVTYNASVQVIASPPAVQQVTTTTVSNPVQSVATTVLAPVQTTTQTTVSETIGTVVPPPATYTTIGTVNYTLPPVLASAPYFRGYSAVLANTNYLGLNPVLGFAAPFTYGNGGFVREVNERVLAPVGLRRGEVAIVGRNEVIGVGGGREVVVNRAGVNVLVEGRSATIHHRR